MASLLKKKKRKLLDAIEDVLDVDEDSEYPVHEKFVKEKKVLTKE